jgi:hypothetical protein
MRQLALSAEQMVSLYNEIDLDLELDHCDDEDEQEMMLAFYTELETIVEYDPKAMAVFDVGLDIADNIASSNYGVSPIFRQHYFRLIKDRISENKK